MRWGRPIQLLQCDTRMMLQRHTHHTMSDILTDTTLNSADTSSQTLLLDLLTPRQLAGMSSTGGTVVLIDFNG